MTFAAIEGRCRSRVRLALAASILVALVAAVGAHGGDGSRAYISPALQRAAASAPSSRFRVIVQGEAGQSSKSVAASVVGTIAGNPGPVRGVGRKFVSIAGVAAELTGRQITHLAERKGIRAITADSPARASVGGPTATEPPTLFGTTEEGDLLFATPGIWVGLEPLAYRYQWQRCASGGAQCADIGGSTADAYVVSTADLGSTLRVAVTATDATGSATSYSVASAVATSTPVSLPQMPTAVVTPSVAGTPRDGETLTADAGGWVADPPPTFTFGWQRCNPVGNCVDVPNATDSTLALHGSDVGSAFKFVVTAENGSGRTTETSAPTPAVAAAPPAAAAAPSVAGQPARGLRLSSAPGSWTGTGPLAYTYRWERCEPATGLCAAIAGADEATYAPSLGDVDARLRVVVTASGPGGNATAASEPTAPIARYSARQVWPYAADAASTWTAAGTLPAIAVVDSGIDTETPGLSGRVIDAVTLTSRTPNSAGDGYGHGTFVAAVAAGDAPGYAGAAPGAPLVSVDVMDDSGMALTSDVIAAADWVYEHKDADHIGVANLSLQSSAPAVLGYDPLEKAVEKLWLGGIVVVAAAGNYAVDGNASGVMYAPGADPFVITVGATDINGTVATADDFAAPWSAYGRTPDGFTKPELAAPGRYVVAAVPTGSTIAAEHPERVVEPGYMQLSGTSFATPVVAGAAAAVLAAHPDWTPDQVKGALMVTAQATAAAGASAGVGAVDAQAAIGVSDPPNPNLALGGFVIADPAGGSTPIFDVASWGATAGSNASWGAASWGAASWGAASWGAASWGAGYWEPPPPVDASTDPVENGVGGEGGVPNNADPDVLPAAAGAEGLAGGYWRPYP